jgi:hypothetical protein
MKVDVKVAKRKLMKKRNTIVESSHSFDSETSLTPSKEPYSMLEVALKND